MKIRFGQAQLEMTFAEAFQDSKWTNFVISHYENSAKPEHKEYVNYVKMMVEKQMKEIKTTKPSMSSEPSDSNPWEENTEVQVSQLHQGQFLMEERMNRLEGALSEVIEHLQKLMVSSMDCGKDRGEHALNETDAQTISEVLSF